jgi:hypothetical protein
MSVSAACDQGEVIQGREKISVAPTPGWLERTKVRNFDRKNGAPVTTLLSERQIHAPSGTVYSRNVNRLESMQAVQQLSRVEIPFDPLTRSLVIHSISIFRGGVLTNHAELSRIELIRREQRLEAGIVNGELSALLLIKDVRIGDVLDVEFSFHDEGSLFAGEMSWIQTTAESFPIGDWLLRWLDVPGRELRISEPGGDLLREDIEVDGLLVRTWSARAVPALEPEPNLPADVFAYPMLQISPFTSWDGIASKLLSKWDFEAADRSALDQEVAAIRAAGAGDDEKLIEAAVASARDAVRYQNYSPGMLAIVPDNVSNIWERRFGDCKEKSLLLVWLLKECGIDAAPALVNSGIGAALPSLLPAPTLFDHVITLVRFGDKTLWIDPTDVYRGGKASAWTSLPFSWALPLESGSAGLVQIPIDGAGSTFLKVRESVTGSRGETEANHEVCFTFGGRRAEFIRGLIDSQGMDGALRVLKGFMESTRPGIELDDHPDYEDDREANVATFRVTGSRPDAVKPHPNQGPDQLLIAPFTFAGLLPGVDRIKRRHPIGMGLSDEIEHLIEVIHPDVTKADYPLQSVANPAFKMKASSHLEAGRPVFKFSCSILKDRVMPEDLAQYKLDVEKAYGIADVSIFLPRDANRRAGPIRLGKGVIRPDAEDAWGDGIPANERPVRRRRSHQPTRPSERSMHPANAMRFGGMGVVLLIIIVKAILVLMRDV